MHKYLIAIWRIISAPFRFFRWLFRIIFLWLSKIFSEIHLFLTEEPEDEPLPDTLAKTFENPTGLFFHIDALRKHLLRSIIFLVITTSFSFVYTKQIIEILAQPVGGLEALRAIDITEPIGVFMRVALLCGFALALPYIALELWLFAAPGLKRKSRIFSLFAIPILTIFFIAGMAFAYYVMLPTAIPFLSNFMGMNTELRPSTYIKFVSGVMFWIGIAFEFPLVIYVLALIRLVNAKQLLNQWRLAVVIIAISAAAITPTVDPVNMSIVMGPMIVLYFISIGLAFIAQRQKT
ncbi:MAG: twin-arginine translocase subunit TatC [Chloroflexi bacterium]|nr:twin-arginine translocase subunit TatC [Chloroflexota bacterium]